MKKRFLTILVMMSAIIMIIAVFGVSLINYNFYKAEIKKEVAMTAKILALDDDIVNLQVYNLPQVNAISAKLANLTNNLNQKLRLTLIAENGKVLYDSVADSTSLENHQNRQEVKQGFKQGWGDIVRYSATTEKETYYYALKVSDTLVLRVAKEMAEISLIIRQSMWVIVGLICFLFVVSLPTANFLVNKTLKSLYDTLKQIKNLFAQDEYDFASIKCYDEIAPFIKEIKNLNLQTKRHLKDLQLQRDTMDSITKNIAEGFILLDYRRNILAINKSAKIMLGAEQNLSAVDANILTVTRSLELQKALDFVGSKTNPQVETNAGTTFVEKTKDGHFYRYFINGVHVTNHVKGGIMILIVDITQEAQAENMRQAFAANVSHELKTPLTTISGFAEMIEAGLIQEQKEIAKANGLILKESKRLVALIDDILRLSEIESNKTQLKIEEIKLTQMLGAVIENLQQVGKNKNISLSCNCELAQDLIIQGNYSMIYELFYNLGENAIKYNYDGGRVDFVLSQVGTMVQLRVEDTGIGIAPEDLSHICERFYRADKSRSKATGGTGLGLSIVKHIVEYHKGKIEIESKLGQGSAFIISLPIKFG